MHNPLYNIIPMALLVGVIVAGLAWAIVADMRHHRRQPRLRRSVGRSALQQRAASAKAPAASSARVSLDA